MMQAETKSFLGREMAHKQQAAKNKQGGGNEAWLDNQEALDKVADQIVASGGGSSNNTNDLATTSTTTTTTTTTLPPKNVKVMESLHRPVDCTCLFDSLLGKDSVHSVSLVGVDLNAKAAHSLCQTLCHAETKIRVLQIWRFVPAFLPAFGLALKTNRQLRELRLTFQREQLDEVQTSILLQALQDNQGLVSIKLFGVDLSRHLDQLASLVRHRQGTQELCLTRCRLTNLGALATAVAESTALQKLDLSMNELSSDNEIAVMLQQSKSLNSIILSKNNFGSSSDATTFGQALAGNQTLEELFLDSNPLSVNFATQVRRALQINTTVRRIGFNKSYQGSIIPTPVDNDIRSLLALNEAGRGWLRAASAPEASPSAIAVLPHILERTRGQPSTLFGVLSQYSNLWVNGKKKKKIDT